VNVARVRPSVVHGSAQAPSSKSYTHRFALAAHLSARPGRVRCPLVSEDTVRTARALRALGSSVELKRKEWRIAPGPGTEPRRVRTIDCGESGTTLRLLTAAAALQRGRYRFVGIGRLPHRPMGPLLDALVELGASVTPGGLATALPFEIRGPIHGGTVHLAVDLSSQFTSALLFALPTLRPRSTVRTVGRPVSTPYVRATLAVMRRQGIRCSALQDGFHVPGGQRYAAVNAAVPGDASSAAYLWAAAALTGGGISIRGIPTWWPQADLAILPLLRQYGAEVGRRGATIRVHGVRRRPFRVRLTDAPDLYPLAGVLAASAPGRSYLLGAEHVVAKESNRRQGTIQLVRALGARVRAVDGGLAIDGTPRLRPVRLRGFHDHRLVMSGAVGALAAESASEIGDSRAVEKSFPEFFRVLGEVELR